MNGFNLLAAAAATSTFGLKQIYFQLILLGVFIVATVVGYMLIKNVPSLLHTPLMSGMNALSGITVLGALTSTAAGFIAAALGSQIVSSIFGIFAIALAMVNVVGGFAVTDRMLCMIVKKKAKGQQLIYIASIIVGVGIIAVAGCFSLMGGNAQYAYLAMAILLSAGVLIGIAFMGNVKYAKIGNRVSAICMLIAIVMTIMYNGNYTVYNAYPIYVGLVLGTIAGFFIAKKVSMLQMPQMVALLNGLGGAASAIVGAFAMFGVGSGFDYFSKITSAIALAVGMLTLTGSLIAAGKLQKILPQKPIVWKGHPLIQMGSVALMLVGIALFIALGGENLAINGGLFVAIMLTSGFFGVAFAIRVGGADMPITISLLNSLSGVAGAIAGLAINDLLLVAIGGIVGASGLLLTQIMCKAMNRSLLAILTGKTTAQPAAKGAAPQAKVEVKAEVKAEVKPEAKPVIEENPAAALKTAKEVIIVPGYGMAIAQAQHTVKKLADKLVSNGVKVKYAVHPVAGRMPGHMNVLLCEADVDYEDLYEMDDINPEFASADATIVVGANDVTNPAAKETKGTPISGMPVLDVNNCKNIFIFNYDLKPGYAGVENPIYSRKDGVHLYLGNAAETLAKFISDIK
ncbi:MAG: NAD(P)(+) transhydrogenase (Re/Si-specific) subunit beta [Clostridia bacterium]